MAGRPRDTARRQAEAARELQRLRAVELGEREKTLMEGRAFTGHDPPVAPDQDGFNLQLVEELVEADPETRRHIAELWPKAYAALEEVLDSPDATATSKVSAAKIVQAAVAAERDAERSALPQKIVFETAAYIPSNAA